MRGHRIDAQLGTVPNNSAGHYRKATAVAFGFISTNSGGIAVSHHPEVCYQDGAGRASLTLWILSSVYVALPCERGTAV